MNAMQSSDALPARGRFDGVRNIFRFNWPFYVIGTGTCVAGMIVLTGVNLPSWLALPGWTGVGLAFFWLLASLLVSFYVYDLSPLYKLTWLRALFPETPQSWVNIHSGLDESSLLLQTLFSAEKQQVLDIYNPQEMTEPAIKRARAIMAPPVRAVAANYAALPLADCSVDTIFLLFAAHEIREPAARLKFFRELKRVTMPDAKVILVEHLRDTANFVAFGPGYWHFMPGSEWQRLADQSGFVVNDTFRITPFVTVFVLQNPGT